MRIIYTTLFVVTSIFIFSCQKEVGFEGSGGSGGGSGGGTGGGGGGGTTGNKLVKLVSKTAVDSTISTYTYDASNRIINEKIVGKDGGIDAGNENRYYRNASGIITHYTQINPNLVLAGIDSVTTNVNYNTSTSRYTSYVSELSLFGFTVKDSSVLVYDANGKVSRVDLYQSIPLLGTFDLSTRTKFTYAANGNMTQMDMYDMSNGTEDIIETIKYTFDSKTSAITYPIEAFVMGRSDMVSVNNATKVEILIISDPTNNVTITSTYNYNANNRPGTGVSTQNPGNKVHNLTFYYQ